MTMAAAGSIYYTNPPLSHSTASDSIESPTRRIYPERSYKPADSLIPLNARPAFTLESQIDRLIERAFIPLGAKMKVTDQGRYFMATNMEDLKDLILECFPAAPSVPKNKKKFQSPLYPGASLKIQSLFKKLLRAATPVKEGRGLELVHIDFGSALTQHVLKIKEKAKGSNSLMPESGTFNQLLWNVGEQRHKQLFPNMPAYASIHEGQLKEIRATVAAGGFVVDSFITPLIESDQREVKASRERAAETDAKTAQIVAAGARAQAAMRPHIPATSTIVANPYWTPSNDASYVAMRAPNGVYY